MASVLIIAAVVITIGITTSLLSIGEGQSSLALTKGEETLNLAESCMEDALLKLRNSSAYAGGSIILPEGTCTVTVSQNNNIYTITATNNGNAYKRTIQTVVNRGTLIIVNSWKEI